MSKMKRMSKGLLSLGRQNLNNVIGKAAIKKQLVLTISKASEKLKIIFAK